MNSHSISAALLLGMCSFSGLVALPIVQTNTAPLLVEPIRPGALGFTQSWQVDEFDPALGVLNSVRIDLSVALTGTTVEVNPFDFSINWQPTLAISVFPFASFQAQDFFGPVFDQVVTDPVRSLAPASSSSFTSRLNGSSSFTLSSPAELAAFYGTGTGKVAFNGRLDTFTGFGEASIPSGNATMTVTYNVPESGSVLTFAFLGAAFLWTFARRRQLA